MNRLPLLLALFALGCGEASTQTIPSALANTEWSSPVSGSVCGADVAFSVNAFTWTNECRLPDGSMAGYTGRGTFMIDGDSVTTTVTEATCPADQIVATLTDAFTIDGDHLSLSGGHGVMWFARVQAPALSPATVGCFEADTGFVPRSLQPL